MTGKDGFRHTAVDVGAGPLHLVEAGRPDGRPILFLHGWPQSWACWTEVMQLAAADGVRALAADLPGVGGSVDAVTSGRKTELADQVRQLIAALDLRDVTLVGQDAGGMTAYPVLRAGDERVGRVVIMDTVIPGVDPWEQVLANPYVWHFAFHSIPGLPEALVQGRQEPYFDYFLDALSPDPARIPPTDRKVYAEAYRDERALKAGFDFYRTMRADAADNRVAAEGPPTTIPLLYVRGEREGGRMEDYVAGFEAAGVADLTTTLIPGAGHFSQADDPAGVWGAIAAFALGS
jgi:pimeloyl-ACP methyl ester carboxylesterase